MDVFRDYRQLFFTTVRIEPQIKEKGLSSTLLSIIHSLYMLERFMCTHSNVILFIKGNICTAVHL